ncbi:SCO family protein [Defluviimonas sp. WL0024]|uniref:SCO family protein n=2 Tax=Albidovulum TaxID=205889 RepID=A0ABT3J0F9_9RHOB|nr:MULTISPECIES: SCO family protein [Defluviimonas]MCU9846909.1 SCO family protein [Defluviimonas sp. WL0024]MCW3781168.1 SCO family protein [Defluviimonas salinarum]
MGLLKALAVILAGLAASPAVAEKLDAEIAYETSQAAIGNATSDHVLTDHRGRTLTLAELRGKPLLVSLIFTSCATVCPITADHLRESVLKAQQALGNDAFNILTFGFDASGDRPAQLAGFAGTHRLVEVTNWQIASADPATTEALLTELGFSFRAGAGGFEHVTQTSLLDAEGRVYRQMYGEAFPLPVLLEPLKELVLGIRTTAITAEGLWDRISFLCTVYNPLTGAYRFDYGIFFGIFFGALSLVLTGIVIFRLWLERRRALKRAERGAI